MAEAPLSAARLASLLEEASGLLQRGALDAARQAYERALASRADLPDAWYNVGYLRHRQGDPAGALAAYAEALRHGVAEPEQVHLNRAVILADHLARHDEAETALREAIALAPAYLPAWLNLANLREQTGDREGALGAYRRVLELEPLHPLALARLPGLLVELNAGDRLLQDLQSRLSRADLSPEDRTELAFGLGKALDRAGQYDAAFAAYDLANRLSLASVGGVRYDPRAHERRVDALMRTYPAETPPNAPPPPAATPGDEPRMIFICGMFRSGSTLVEQILGSHPLVTACGEFPFIPRMAASVPLGAPPSDALVAQMRAHYLRQVRLMHPHAGVVTDKRPDNFLHLGLIRRLFPDATIVHTRRHPLDNALSVYFLHLDQAQRYALHLDDIAHWYGQYRRVMAHWTSAPGPAIVDVDYEALVREPEAVIAGLLEACGLPWSDTCLRFHESRIVVKTPSAWQVRQPLYRQASGRWRHYERHLQGLRAALARWLGEEERAGGAS